MGTLELELFGSSGTLFDLEMKGIIRKPFSKVLRKRQIGASIVGLRLASHSEAHPPGPLLHQNGDPVGIRAGRLR